MNIRRLLTFALISLASCTPSAFDLDSLLRKSVGGEAAINRIDDLQSMYAEGAITLNGMPGRFSVAVLLPDKFLLTLQLGGFELAQGFDGETAWYRDPNGAVSILSGYERQEMLNQVYLQSMAFLSDDTSLGDVEYLGLDQYDGTTYYKVALYPYHADTLYTYFDTTNAHQVITVGYHDNLQTVSTSSDFRTVDDILMAFKSETVAIGAPVSSVSVMERIVLDTILDPSIFGAPAVKVQDFHFPDQHDSVIVPFAYSNGHIYIAAIINGKKRVRLILDSGASANVFHKPAIADLGMTPIGTVAAKGVGGYEEIELFQTDSLQVGDLVLRSQVAGAMDLSRIGREVAGDPFGGVLGYDFLSRFPVKIDYQHQELTVYHPERFAPRHYQAEVPFTLTMNIPSIEAEIAGDTGLFIVDLGNAFGVVLHQEFFDKEGLENKLHNIQKVQGSIGGVGGGIGNRSAYASTFSFANVRVTSLRVLIADAGAGLTGSTEIAGNIGNLFWQSYQVTIDYPGSRLLLYALEPDENKSDSINDSLGEPIGTGSGGY